MDKWIVDNFLITMNGDEIIFPIDSVSTILVPVSFFIGLFGSVIEVAINNGVNPIDAIRSYDVDNVNGYNHLIGVVV